jgi:hypothetical protein
MHLSVKSVHPLLESGPWPWKHDTGQQKIRQIVLHTKQGEQHRGIHKTLPIQRCVALYLYPGFPEVATLSMANLTLSSHVADGTIWLGCISGVVVDVVELMNDNSRLMCLQFLKSYYNV